MSDNWERQGKPDCYSECSGCTSECPGLAHWDERAATLTEPFDPRTPEAQARFRERWRVQMRDLLREKGVEDEKIDQFLTLIEADVEKFVQEMKEREESA